MALLLETIWGDLVLDLDVEGSPELCRNLLKLAKVRYFTQTLIFSVTPNRFCQAGDPVGDGTGGACIYGVLEGGDERQSRHRFLKSDLGRPLSVAECQEKGRVVATCQAGGQPDTVGSQFLITTAAGPDHALDGYRRTATITSSTSSSNQDATTTDSSSAFLSLGIVAEDENGVLDKINAAYTDPDGRPYADIRILRALVLHDPFDDDPPGMEEYMKKRGVQTDDTGRVVASPSPERPAAERVTKRISAAEIAVEDDDDEDMRDGSDDNKERAQKRQRQQRAEQQELARREDQSRAVVLEMLGDLPDADIRAPEETLFICKLNPATVDEDLELILSRFDEQVKVEIIRDADTGASLQYAFCEFSNKQAAQEAFFKMNNALVDDRRIKVDFSQSVAKLWDKYNQKMRMPRVGMGAGGGGRGGGRGQSRGPVGRGRGGGGPGGRVGGRGGRGWNPPQEFRHQDHPRDRHHHHHHHDSRNNQDRRPSFRDREPQRHGVDDFGRSREIRPDDSRRGERHHSHHSRSRDAGSRDDRDRDHHRQYRVGEGREERSGRDDNDGSRERSGHKKHRKKEERRRHDSRGRGEEEGRHRDQERRGSGYREREDHQHRDPDEKKQRIHSSDDGSPGNESERRHMDRAKERRRPRRDDQSDDEEHDGHRRHKHHRKKRNREEERHRRKRHRRSRSRS